MSHLIEYATAFQKCGTRLEETSDRDRRELLGDIRLTRKMEVSTIESPEKPGRDWLSCCSLGGYGEMECEKIWDEEKVFEGGSRDVAL